MVIGQSKHSSRRYSKVCAKPNMVPDDTTLFVPNQTWSEKILHCLGSTKYGLKDTPLFLPNQKDAEKYYTVCSTPKMIPEDTPLLGGRLITEAISIFISSKAVIGLFHPSMAFPPVLSPPFSSPPPSPPPLHLIVPLHALSAPETESERAPLQDLVWITLQLGIKEVRAIYLNSGRIRMKQWCCTELWNYLLICGRSSVLSDHLHLRGGGVPLHVLRLLLEGAWGGGAGQRQKGEKGCTTLLIF